MAHDCRRSMWCLTLLVLSACLLIDVYADVDATQHGTCYPCIPPPKPDCQAEVYMFSSHPFVGQCVRTPNERSFVCSEICEHILKTNELSSMQIGTSCPQGQLWRSRGQRSRSHEAEDGFDGMEEESFSTPLDRVAFFRCIVISK